MFCPRRPSYATVPFRAHVICLTGPVELATVANTALMDRCVRDCGAVIKCCAYTVYQLWLSNIDNI